MTRNLVPRPILALAAAVAVVLAACSGGAERATDPGPPASTPASTSPAAAATIAPTPAAGQADAERAFAHLQVLAVAIGSRVAGSPEERAAADYVAGQLADAGYVVSIETFPVPPPPDAAEASSPALGEVLPARFMAGAPRIAAEGHVMLVPGHGSPADFASVEAGGAVAVVQRGVLTFAAKAQNAARAGASALLVVNNEAGELLGMLGDARPAIPVLGISSEAGAALEALEAASPGALLSVGPTAETLDSQNVVARAGDAECTAYLGAHYDSVPSSPGANDNASGVALILELARVLRGAPGADASGVALILELARVLRGAPGAESLCVVAFGAEEVGLVGSEAFVAAHDVGDEAFMLNFDMVSKMTAPVFVRGHAGLADYASIVARDLGEELPAAPFPPYASSDHASFDAAGVPAITVHSGDDTFIHSPEDDIANASRDDLARMLSISEELARRLLATGGIPRE